MKRESIIFTNEADWLNARKHDLTSTDIASLFGVGRKYPFELYHMKKSLLDDDFEGNERTEWGLALQDAIMAKFAKDNSWEHRRMNEYIRIPELRIASSFDFEISYEDEVEGESFLNKEIVEIKNVDSLQLKENWLINEDGEYEATPAIELQVQHQLLVSGYNTCRLCVCVGGNRGIHMVRKANPKIHSAILERARIFWASVESGIAPEPDYIEDAKFISKLYNTAEDDKVFDATVDHDIQALMSDYKKYKE